MYELSAVLTGIVIGVLGFWALLFTLVSMRLAEKVAKLEIEREQLAAGLKAIGLDIDRITSG